MKITITRAFERTRQIADFVPIKAYCEASVEYEMKSPIEKEEEARLFTEASARMAAVVQEEVDKTLAAYRPTCIVCGGRGDKVNLNKEGVCGQCVKDMQMQALEFRRDGKVEKTK